MDRMRSYAYACHEKERGQRRAATIRNLLVMLGAIAISFAYLLLSPIFVPDKYALILNFGLLPAVLGLFAGFVLTDHLPKLVLMPAIPIAHVLVLGGDAAKPGLENLLAVVEFGPLCFGCMVGHFLASKRTVQTPS